MDSAEEGLCIGDDSSHEIPGIENEYTSYCLADHSLLLYITQKHVNSFS